MSEQKFKVGDVAVLNSDSPLLTITGVWTNTDNEECVSVVFYRDGSFPTATLLASCLTKN